MKVLIFGGTGWVGHNIAKVFHDDGADVTICSRGRTATYLDDIPDDIRRLQADKESEADVRTVFEERYDVVIDSVPTEGSIDNIAAQAGRFRRYIHCGSTGGYEPLPSIPGDETMPYDHFMGGWKEKGIADVKVMDLFHREGFPATVLRPCYITGPGMLPLDNLGGRREDFIDDILADREIVLPNDGQALLQPVHVVGLAEAFLLAALEPRSVGQIYNICLEKAVTIERYVELNAEALDRRASISFLPVETMLEKYDADPVGLHFFATHMCFDISKARDQLGYVPPMTTEEAIFETARWAATQRKTATEKDPQ